jgi:DNA polymerase I-like protein with 3'-5' exonuclease and polymerase domains
MVIADEVIHTHPYFTANQLAFIHDELQFETPPKYERDIRFILEYTAVRAGEYYKTRIPIAAESKSGRNWSEVH